MWGRNSHRRSGIAVMRVFPGSPENIYSSSRIVKGLEQNKAKVLSCGGGGGIWWIIQAQSHGPLACIASMCAVASKRWNQEQKRKGSWRSLHELMGELPPDGGGLSAQYSFSTRGLFFFPFQRLTSSSPSKYMMNFRWSAHIQILGWKHVPKKC